MMRDKKFINDRRRPCIAVLMSTYNGELYVKEQLQSLLDQNVSVDFNIYVRDDGSSDSTWRIVSEMAQIDHRIILCQDTVEHRGCKDSFIWLLENIIADYYMFCDQDDIWLPEKIELSYREIKKMDSVPGLVCTDLRVVNNALETIYNSMWKSNHTDKIISDIRNLQIASMYTGCTMIFNNKTRNQIIKNKSLPVLHDQIAALSVYKIGGVIRPINTQSILYRQHNNNVLGTNVSGNLALSKILNIKKTISQNYDYYKLVHSFLGTTFIEFIMLKINHILKY